MSSRTPAPVRNVEKSSPTLAIILEMSSIFDRVLDAFKLIGFQPNLKHNSLRAFGDNP